MADLVACSVLSSLLNNPRDGTSPVAYTPACHACVVHVLPAGDVAPCLTSAVCSATVALLGSPLPRLVLIELRCPGEACLFLHEGRRADGSH